MARSSIRRTAIPISPIKYSQASEAKREGGDSKERKHDNIKERVSRGGGRDESGGGRRGKIKEGNTNEGDGERDDEKESSNSWRERARELKEEAERERENVFNYSALPMFSIYGPFRAASRNYIYSYCRHRLLP